MTKAKRSPQVLSSAPAGPLLAGSRQVQTLRDPDTTLIRINEVVAIVGLSRPTIYKLMRQPESGFPLPVKLSDSTARGAPVAWVLGEINAWVLARIAARGKAAA